MFETYKRIFNVYAFSALLLLLFVTEAYFKILLFLTIEEPILLQTIKGFVLASFGFYIVITQPKQLWSILVLCVSFFIGQFALEEGLKKETIIALVKLVYPLVLLLFFNNYPFTQKQKKILFLALEYILLFNASVIVIGFLFNIYIFNSYLGSRFGFNGLFISASIASYVYSFGLIYLLAKYKKSIFKRIANLIIIGSMFLIGTKVSYLFLICFFVIYLWNYTTINKKLILGGLITLGSLVFYVFFFKYSIFNEIRQSDGLISSLMSYRDELLLERTIPFIKECWSLTNYFFGGVSDLFTKSQIEFIDIFYFLGLFGGLLYYYIFFKAFLIVKFKTHITILLSVLFILVLLAGNFFSYPSIAIYLVVLREYLKFNEQNKNPQYFNP